MSEKALQRWLDQELEVMVHVHEVRNEYEKQSQLSVFYIFLNYISNFVANRTIIFPYSENNF